MGAAGGCLRCFEGPRTRARPASAHVPRPPTDGSAAARLCSSRARCGRRQRDEVGGSSKRSSVVARGAALSRLLLFGMQEACYFTDVYRMFVFGTRIGRVIWPKSY